MERDRTFTKARAGAAVAISLLFFSTGCVDRIERAFCPGPVQVGRYESDQQVGNIAFSPSGKYMVTSGWKNGSVLLLWDLEKRTILQQVDMGEEAATDVQFSPLETHLAVTGHDGTLYVWRFAGRLRSLKKVKYSNNYTTGVAFHPDGDRLATGGFDREINFWSVHNLREPVFSFPGHRHTTADLFFDPGGGRLITGSRDNTIRIWDSQTGEELQQMFVRTYLGVTDLVYVSPGVLGAADATGGVSIWNYDTGKQLFHFTEHSELGTASIDYNPRLGVLLSLGLDNKIFAWDLKQGGKRIAKFCAKSSHLSIRFLPDDSGRYLRADERGGLAIETIWPERE